MYTPNYYNSSYSLIEQQHPLSPKTDKSLHFNEIQELFSAMLVIKDDLGNWKGSVTDCCSVIGLTDYVCVYDLALICDCPYPWCSTL